jgi:hypothetical protein
LQGSAEEKEVEDTRKGKRNTSASCSDLLSNRLSANIGNGSSNVRNERHEQGNGTSGYNP